ncbi:AAA family ATPase, partial [Legionella pneumophila serogroup 1]
LDDTELFEDEKEQENINKLVGVSLSGLLAMELPPREYLLEPWLPKSGLCMVYAKRGVGKTFFALEVAVAVAYGTSFLSFKAPKPAKVLYVDGEMPANVMKERLAEIISRLNINNNEFDPIFITPDLQKGLMPNLGNVQDHAMLEEYTDQADLIIFDNISTLSSYGKENEAESWHPFQQLALKLRKKGKSVLFIHHAGKQGTARGTSKREDILDTVINLRHPSDYTPSKGACFELHFEKTRSMMGDNATPILCHLTSKGWEHQYIDRNDNAQRVIELYKSGLKQSEIVKELDLSKGHVSKLLKAARNEGKLDN